MFSAKQKNASASPLADRMRPRTLEDIVGQDHIVGHGRLLRRAIQADRLSSIIFYGPPGTGKTSLAAVIANTTRAAFENMNAVLAGVKDIREVIDRSDERSRLYSKRTILFVDEVHRWNKAQQDALLPWVENGTVILIGATTENPFFEVNRALVSRSRIFQLAALGKDELLETARRALADKRGYGSWKVVFQEGALEHLVEVAGGDARSLLNAMELAVETSDWTAEGEPQPGAGWPPPAGASINVSMQAAEESIQRRALLYDRDGDYHFDTISAFIKSVRGSDPDAALYWLAKMVRAGEDPKFIFRRMIILASEDVGLADPAAIGVVVACAQAFERIGFPEGNFPLAQACLYLATAPKSNTTMAFFDALKEVNAEDAEVPNHLRDPSRDAEGFGHGEGYAYPHSYREHWVAQQYLPSALRGRTFYIPSVVGYEGKIRGDVLQKRELQAAIILGEKFDGAQDILSWSASSKSRQGWFKRLESGRSKLLLADREAIFNAAAPRRHDRSLIPLANDGLLLWESMRRSPEGLSAAIVGSQSAKDALLQYASVFDTMEKPEIAVSEELFPPGGFFSSDQFEHILIRAPRFKAEADRLAAGAASLLAPGGNLVLITYPPLAGERISRIILEECGGSKELSFRLKEAEDIFFAEAFSQTAAGAAAGELCDTDSLQVALREKGFNVEAQLLDRQEERLISEKELAAWFDTANSRWGAFMEKSLPASDFLQIREALETRLKKGPVLWRWKSLFLHARRH